MENLNQEMESLPQKNPPEKTANRVAEIFQHYYQSHYEKPWKMQHTQPLIHQQQIESIVKEQSKTLRKLQNIALILYLPVIATLLYQLLTG